jgi:hypothetical protein
VGALREQLAGATRHYAPMPVFDRGLLAGEVMEEVEGRGIVRAGECWGGRPSGGSHCLQASEWHTVADRGLLAGGVVEEDEGRGIVQAGECWG